MSESLPEVTPEVLDRVEAAASADGLITDPLATSAPTNDSTTATPATPEAAATEAGSTEAPAEESFTRLDPSTLSPELQTIYRSMQADYTRKTQEVAPFRQLAEELGVDDPTVLKQAADLYSYLQDESNLRSFTERLASEFGLIGQHAAATDPASVDDTDDLDIDSADPRLSATEQRIAQLEARLEEAARREETERLQWAIAGEVARQEAMLAEQHPEWRQEDWDAVYDLAPAFDGDLIKTANALEGFASARLAGYLNGKTAVSETPALQPTPPVRTAETPVEVTGENDYALQGATAEAKAYLREVLAQSE